MTIKLNDGNTWYNTKGTLKYYEVYNLQIIDYLCILVCHRANFLQFLGHRPSNGRFFAL